MRRHRLTRNTALAAAGGLATSLVVWASPASAAIPPITAAKVTVSATTEVPVGFGAAPAGNIVVGDSTILFQAGDSISIRIDDADTDPNCKAGPGFRDFVAFEGTPNATIPGPTASVQVSMGSTPLCAAQEGGTKFDVVTVSVLIGGPGPITIGNIRYTAGSSGTIDGSASTGPVQLQFQGGGAVGAPFSLVTADTSNAWVTDITTTGGTVSKAITLPSPPVTLDPITISEHLTDAFGPAGTASDVCLDLSGLATWSAIPTSTGSGTVPSDVVNGVIIDTGPAGPSTRLKVSIQNNPTSVQSVLTLTGMKVQPGNAPGRVQLFTTDCDSPPFGTRASGGNPQSGTTFDTIGYFSNPSKNIFPVPPDIIVTPSAKSITRLAGADRIDTADAISQTSFPATGSANAVVLARADTFPDALAGTPLAAAKSAPLLLTGSASLDPRTQAEIQRVLTPGKTVFLLGGSAALSPTIASALGALGYAIVRFDGIDRFDTAMRIARDGLNNPTNLFVADGLNFPDALGAGAAAAKQGGAVLLSAGSSPVAITSSYISTRPSLSLTTVGGPAAAAYPAGQAVVGVDRYDTSAQLAARFFATPGTIGLASGTNFPDALAGGAHIARFSGPMLLTDPNALPTVIQAYLTAKASSIVAGFLYGGTNAVSDSVRVAAQTAIGGTTA